MYLSFYRLKEKPFNISTDPRFLWYGEKHREALANLKYGLLEGNGYVVLTGDVGMGKTTLVNALIETLDDNVLVANINHPTLDTIEFLSLVAKTYDASAEIANKTDFLLFFKSFLQQTYTQNKTALLVIDEAHRLSKELLEEIRLLSNMEQTGNKLINIFFVGQNELKLMLLSPECHALRQRITLFYDIHPLSEDETLNYVAHRLKVAGTEEQLFTSGAIHQIQDFTRGYPRLINIICDRAMLTGYVKEQKKIDTDIVAECAREISFLDPTASKTETIEIDKFSSLESPPVVGLSTQAVGLENDAPEEPTVEKIHDRAKSFKKAAYQRTGSFVKKNRRKLIPVGLAAAIVLLAVTVGIGVNTGSNIITDGSIQVDRTVLEEKVGVPDHRAALAMPQQSADMTASVSETSIQTASKAAPQMLKQEPVEKVVELKKKNAPVNQMPTVAASPSLVKTPSPEAKPKMQNKSPSEAMMRKAVEADPKNARAHFNLGKIYTRAKEYDRAIEAYQNTIALDPNLSDAIFNLGFIHATTGRYKDAERFFARVVQLKPSYLDKALFNLALVQEKLGKKQESLVNLQAAVAVRPENQKVRAYLKQVESVSEENL